MKRAFLLLLPAVLLVFLAVAGCNDESNPTFTRIRVFPDCGVAPLQVEGLAIASGGNESGDPTGGNNNLEISWDFGDDHGTGETSIVYYTYTNPGEYQVVVTATDPDGKVATTSYPVTVLPDSLNIAPFTNFPDNAVTTADSVRFDLRAWACDIDPDVDGDYVKMTFKWNIGESQFTSRNPIFRFDVADTTYEATVAVTYPALAVVRHASLMISVSAP
jgi:hypothetical protein